MNIDLEILPLPAIICNSFAKIIKTNSAFDNLIGTDNLQGSSLLSITLPKYKQDTYNILKNSIPQKQIGTISELINYQGQTIHIQLNVKKIDHDLNLVLVCNITEFKNTEEKLLNTIIASEEKERRRIATELHDNLNPILSAIKLYIDLLKKNIPPKNYDQIKNIDDLINLAITTAKEISYNITPCILHDFGLAEAIKKFAQMINDTNKLTIKIKTDRYTIKERIVAEAILYHAAKELINNTIKHAQATEAIIELRNTDKQIVLYYKDNGKGFNIQETMEQGRGLGLRNLIHKVESLKGNCDFYSKPDEGFIAIITVPITKNNSYV